MIMPQFKRSRLIQFAGDTFDEQLDDQ